MDDQQTEREVWGDVYALRACEMLLDWRLMSAKVSNQGRVLSCPDMRMLD
jgi:hypothetical protein